MHLGSEGGEVNAITRQRESLIFVTLDWLLQDREENVQLTAFTGIFQACQCVASILASILTQLHGYDIVVAINWIGKRTCTNRVIVASQGSPSR